MRKQAITYILLAAITFLAGFVRFYDITKNPPGLNIDEVSFGYSAYSILKTGKDENGVFMPLAFRSTGDYKNPVPVYLLVPSIWAFGLNEWAVRFPMALIGILSIPIFFFFLKFLLKKDWIALTGALLMAISSWHIYFSRFAYDPLLASFFLILGIWFFLKMLEGKRIWGIFSALFFVISMYSAFTERLFVPFFIFISLLLNRKTVFQHKKIILIFISVCIVLVAPLIFLSMFGGANTRFGMIFLTQDIEYTRYAILDHLFRPGESLITFFFWAKRYLSYLQPDFLFLNGLNLTSPGTFGLGVLYLFELPLFILGIISLIKNNFKWKNILLIWLFLGIFPASLANNETSEGRSLIVLPAVLIILTLGSVYATHLFKKIESQYLRWAVFSIYLGLIAINLIQAFLIFAVHFPNQKGEAFMEGTKESVVFAIEHKNEFEEIVYDASRGIEGPYTVNIPHIYILFYSKYDPVKFSNEAKYFQTKGAHFDKFTIRGIDWPADVSKKGTLFIGSPWTVPDKDSEHVKVLKKIYLTNGSLALVIVTPK